jgi:hypothetical protein
MDNILSGALELFGFKEVKYSATNRRRFQFKEMAYYGNPFECNCAFRSIPMIVEFFEPTEYGYATCANIIEPIKDTYLSQNTGDIKKLVKEIINNRKEYFKNYFAYNVQRVVREYNVVTANPISLQVAELEMYVVCKEYEVGRWGGVDKDNHYTTYIDYDYFLVHDDDILINDYIRSIIQKPWTKQIKYYQDYRPTSEVATPKYCIEKVDNVLLDIFKTAHSQYDHDKYIKSLNKP